MFYNALGYAVEQGHLASNPVDRVQWTTPAVAQSVDRRVVVSPAQARSLLAAVRAQGGRGQHLEAFFACACYPHWHHRAGSRVATPLAACPDVADPGWQRPRAGAPRDDLRPVRRGIDVADSVADPGEAGQLT